MLHVFLIEAVRLGRGGRRDPEDIDTACRLGLGHPIGRRADGRDDVESVSSGPEIMHEGLW